ncbi:MAG TPA: ABC-type transport auxiliary lipoprotein family protein [Alphaproteobacteria bacterium]|jgi:cholesterol transport system auxiliary component|nr:ABC-type transport auxiliary lipoprotein family protein [Alphaproteobacteria bacterium]
MKKAVAPPLLAPILLALALTGCSASGLLAPSGAAPKIYTLSAPKEVASSAPQANWQLLIAMPGGVANLNTTRIAIIPAPSRMDYYADVTWADRPPAMLQELLLQSFDRSGRIAAVQRQSGGLKSDFLLTTEIEDFEVDNASGEPNAHIRVAARLVRNRDRTIVAARNFEAAVPSGTSFDGAIAAFDSGLQSVLPQMVDWTLTQGSQHQ